MQRLLLTAGLVLTILPTRAGTPPTRASTRHVELRLEVVPVIVPDPGTIAGLLLYGSAILGGQHAS